MIFAGSQDNSRSRSHCRILDMIENLEFWILHLKAGRRAEDPALRICAPSPLERSSTKKIAGKIPQVSNRSQSIYKNPKNRPSEKVSRKVTLVQPNCKPVIHPFQGKTRNMGGILFTCDARPHSPWSIVSSRKSVVGSGLLVHFAAHIAELIKNTSLIQTNPTNIKKPRFQSFEYGIGLFVLNETLRDSSFQKIL